MTNRKAVFSVSGMDCASCSVGIEKSLKQTEGVKGANVSFTSGKAEVEFEEGKTTVTKLKDAIVKQGYEAKVSDIE
ncbi:cation transporter [Candidatus Micrarchaeota archaeon]|nr:cation transporter [Candidatus Micrarchaeota archaeon]